MALLCPANQRPTRPLLARIFLVTIAPWLAGCVSPGLLTDGSSVSFGSHARGWLRAGTPLPPRGEGYVIPTRWRERQRNYGTDELVNLLVHSARAVRRVHDGAILGVADLSPRGGGRTPEHKSHHSGRDVDLLPYAIDLERAPVSPTEMVVFDASGNSPPPRPPAAGPTGAPQGEPRPRQPQRFDLERNWALVRALVTHPEVRVQWIFLGQPLIRMLLDHAVKRRAPGWLIQRAAAVLHQPGDAQNHMDHFHVRIFCPPSDRHQGCVDGGPPRWLKKTIKYPYLEDPFVDQHPAVSATGQLRRVRLGWLHR